MIATRLDSPWGYTAITDEHGYYAFPELPPGNYVVTFDHLDGTTSQLAEVDSRAATPVFETVWKPLVPIVIEPLSSTVSFTGTTSVQNSFVVDSIDVSGLTFGDDE